MCLSRCWSVYRSQEGGKLQRDRPLEPTRPLPCDVHAVRETNITRHIATRHIRLARAATAKVGCRTIWPVGGTRSSRHRGLESATYVRWPKSPFPFLFVRDTSQPPDRVLTMKGFDLTLSPRPATPASLPQCEIRHGRSLEEHAAGKVWRFAMVCSRS